MALLPCMTDLPEVRDIEASRVYSQRALGLGGPANPRRGWLVGLLADARGKAGR